MKFIYITMTQRAIGLLAGLSLIVFGVIVDTKSVTYLGFFMPSSGNFNPISISLQIVGALIFIVGFFGCCAASKGCFGAVVTFVVFLCILLLAQVTLAFTAIVYRHQMKEHIEAGWLSSMEEYGRSSQLSDAWNYIQQQFSCCGVSNYTDWTAIELSNHRINNVSAATAGSIRRPSAFATSTAADAVDATSSQVPFSTANHRSLPDSCCVRTVTQRLGCGQNVLDTMPTLFASAANRSTADMHRVKSFYTQGCIASITEWAVDNVVMILAIAAYVVVIQLIGIVLTSSLARKIRKECQDMADPEYSVKSDGIDSAG